MSSRLQIFQQYAAAVDTLRTHFSDRSETLIHGESLSQYELAVKIKDIAWLREHLLPLTESLLPARFSLKLVVTVHYLRAELHIRGDSTRLEIDCEHVEFLEESPREQLLPAAVEAFETLQSTLRTDLRGQPIEALYALLEAVALSGGAISLSLQVFLDKTRVNRLLGTEIAENVRPRIVSFLFPEALVAVLQQSSLARFEEEFCQYGRRTVTAIFGFSGCLYSDVLAVCGRGYEHRLDTFLTTPLSDEVSQKIKKSLDFRQSQSVWSFPTTWLTPEAFAITVEFPAEAKTEEEILRHLRGFQAVLSAIFLADSVDMRDQEYWVEYRGLGRTRLPIQRVTFLQHETRLEELYQLYVYAYDGFSADKLEIAQQFLSLTATSLETLCSRTSEIKDATKKTYDRALVEKVADYFNARHKVQECIEKAIGETANNMISLTRDVSADLYKVVGVLCQKGLPLCQKGLPLYLKADILHPLSQCRGLFGKPLEDRRGQSQHIETVTHCLYNHCSLITTSCKLSSPFLPFLGKAQGFRMPTRRTANDEQAPHLQRPEAVADIALVALKGPYQLLMTARDQSTGPLVIHGQPPQHTFLES